MSMGVLALRLGTLDSVACRPIDSSEQFVRHVSAKSPSNISPNPSEGRYKVSEI
jgi:hypothetical protein